MSTRSVIARVGEHEGQFAGRYVHADGYPTGLGAFLWKSLRGHFKNNLGAMLRYLIDAEHAQCGWSALLNKDFTLKPGYTWERAYKPGVPFAVYSETPDYRRPQCYAGRSGEEPYLFTEKDLESTDCEWLYVFDEEQQKLFVRDLNHKEDVAVIDLDGDEPKWEHVECGENWERCHHYAWKHGLLPQTSNLSTQTWLGKRPLEFHDAIAFIVGGKRYKNSGSGGDADFRRSYDRNKFPSGTWVQALIAGNGKHLEVPVAKRTDKGFAPLSGVAWVYPPTKDNPQETIVESKA